MVRIQLFSFLSKILLRFRRNANSKVCSRVSMFLYNFIKKQQLPEVRPRYLNWYISLVYRDDILFRLSRKLTVVPTRQTRTHGPSVLGILLAPHLHLQFIQVWPTLTSKLYSVVTISHSRGTSKLQNRDCTPIFKAPSSVVQFHKLHSGWWCSVQLIKWYRTHLEFLQLEWWRGAVTAKLKRFSHQLRFRFINSRFTLLFTNPQTRSDYFFVSAGLFTRYFFFQKSVKRSRALKLIMARFARKMLILLGLKDLTLVVRGLPFMLEQLITTLFAPLRHPFKNLLTGELLDEVNTAGISLQVGRIVFLNIKPFGFMKTRLRGRIKRKIRRRIHRATRSDY